MHFAPFVDHLFQKKNDRRSFNENFRNIYKKCFNLDVVSGDWAPDSICHNCRKILSIWKKTKDDSKLIFIKPTEWNEPSKKDDCYFCNTDIPGYNQKNLHNFEYAQVGSVKKALERTQTLVKVDVVSIGNLSTESNDVV